MKKFASLLLCSLWCLLAQAQLVGASAASGTSLQASMDADRARISSERAQLEKGFSAEDAVCARKFLVNNCLDEVKARRREVMADLRRQEILLNEQGRKARAADQVLKTEQKAAPERQQEAADRRAIALKEFDDRMDRDKEKNGSRAIMQSNEKANSGAAANRQKENQVKASSRSEKQVAAAEETRKFAERQQKAKERKERHDRDQASQTKPPAKPLPSPQ